MSRKSPTHITEQAMVNVLTLNRPSGLTGVTFLTAYGQFTPTITLPRIVFQVTRATEVAYECNVFEVEMDCIVETEVDDEVAGLSATKDTHRNRVEAVRDFLENMNALWPLINGLTGITDPPFALSSLMYQSESESLVDRTLTTRISYELGVCTSPDVGTP